MALPGQGNSLSMGQIAQELGIQNSNLSLREISQFAGFAEPDAISEFYGYGGSTGGPKGFTLWNSLIFEGDPCNGILGDVYIEDNTKLYFFTTDGGGKFIKANGFYYIFEFEEGGEYYYQEWVITSKGSPKNFGYYISPCPFFIKDPK